LVLSYNDVYAIKVDRLLLDIPLVNFDEIAKLVPLCGGRDLKVGILEAFDQEATNFS
jgi:hypothetical protein